MPGRGITGLFDSHRPGNTDYGPGGPSHVHAGLYCTSSPPYFFPHMDLAISYCPGGYSGDGLPGVALGCR